MPRNLVNNELVPDPPSVQETAWVEVNRDDGVITPLGIIYALQRAIERLPKDAYDPEINRVVVGEEELTVDGLLDFRLQYRRPETDDERVERQRIEERARERERILRRQQYEDLRREFGDNPEPLPEPQPQPEPARIDLDQVLEQIAARNQVRPRASRGFGNRTVFDGVQFGQIRAAPPDPDRADEI